MICHSYVFEIIFFHDLMCSRIDTFTFIYFCLVVFTIFLSMFPAELLLSCGTREPAFLLFNLTNFIMSFPQILVDESESAQFIMSKRKLNSLAASIFGIAALGQQATGNENEAISFKVHLERATSRFNKFENLWSNLDEMYVKEKEYAKFPTEDDSSFYRAVSNEIMEANVCLAHVKKWDQSVPREDDPTPRPHHTTMGVSRSPHLPKVNIPIFDGDLVKWTTFRDTYVSLVHDEPCISNIEKFNCLRVSLKGEASTYIANISVNNDNYSLAWKAILQAYDNPRVLASFYVKKVLEYSSSHSKPSLESYQKYLSGVVDNIEAFKQLTIYNSTDFLLALLALRALDSETRRDFELIHLDKDFPKSEDVFSYVRNRIKAFRLSSDDIKVRPDIVHKSASHLQARFVPNKNSKRYTSSSFHTTNAAKPAPQMKTFQPTSHRGEETSTKEPCPTCKGPHPLGFCIKFKNFPLEKKWQTVRDLKLCHNCLNKGHYKQECVSRFSCKTCGRRHHTLVHPEEKTPEPSSADSSQPSGSKNFYARNQENLSPRQVLLGTALVTIKSSAGRTIIARVLLDSCSERTFMTEKLSKRLGCRPIPCTEKVAGMGGVALHAPIGVVSCFITGCNTELPIDAAVVESISSASPLSAVSQDIIDELSNNDLADNRFGQPGPVDILIGADVYPALLTGAPIRTRFLGLFLIPTIFGLVVIGNTGRPSDSLVNSMATFSLEEIDRSLKRFWELEEPSSARLEDPEDIYCEEHFSQTHYRNQEGRYVVELPLARESLPCGNNRDVVERRFFNLEKRLHSDKKLYGAYARFMSEYIDLGHMVEAQSPSEYIIPHHGIWQGHWPNQKLRVVFDASCPSKSEYSSKPVSLNDTLLNGPKLQLDISDILIRFRTFVIALTCDIIKMYRQVLVHPQQRKLQHIFWRSHPSLPLKEYEMNTLTYGEKPCAFLAIRTIVQLTRDEEASFPLASEHIKKAMYVDDFVSGADTMEEAITLKNELIGIFARGGFELDKWASNEPSLLPQHQGSNDPLAFTDIENNHTKILGLVWDPAADVFSYSAVKPDINVTKRSILSAIARTFDPLGLLAPVIFSAKVVLQEVWKQKNRLGRSTSSALVGTVDKPQPTMGISEFHKITP